MSGSPFTEELLASIPAHELWARGDTFVRSTMDLMAALDNYAEALNALTGNSKSVAELFESIKSMADSTLILAAQVANTIEDQKSAHAKRVRAQEGPFLKLVVGD